MDKQNNQNSNNPQNEYPQNGYPGNGYPQQNGYPQNGYPQNGYPQFGYPVRPVNASPGEKDAYFSTASSVWMLIACIMITVNMVSVLLENFIIGIVDTVLNLLIVIGFWMAFANAKKKNLKTTGINLIRIPYIIRFVFLILEFIGNIFLWTVMFNLFSLMSGILSFIFQCICFSSVKKTLNMALRINEDKSAAGMKAGVFAGVIMIITAAFTFISDMARYLFTQAILSLISQGASQIDPAIANIINTVMGGTAALTIVAAVVAFIASISVAIVLLKFHKKIKEVNG